MIQTENPRQHELMKEIVRLTMLLKTHHPAVYALLEETPITKSPGQEGDLKALEDYRNTLAIQLKDAETQKGLSKN